MNEAMVFQKLHATGNLLQQGAQQDSPRRLRRGGYLNTHVVQHVGLLYKHANVLFEMVQQTAYSDCSEAGRVQTLSHSPLTVGHELCHQVDGLDASAHTE